MKIFPLTWVVGITLLIIITYPASPVFYLVFLDTSHEIYMLMVLILIAALIVIKKAERKTGSHRAIALAGIGFTFMYVANFAITENITAIRDALTLGIVTLFLIKIDSALYLQLLRRYIALNAIFLAISITLLALYYYGIIDLTDWHVNQLNYVNKNNPAVIRDTQGDFSYHLLFYLLVIPFADELSKGIFGIEYLRQPLLYTEPAYTWLYTAGIFLFSLGDKNMPYRILIIIILGIALLISYSVQGVASLTAGIFLLVLLYNFKVLRDHNKVFFLAILIIVSLGIYLDIHESIIAYVDSSKYDQYNAARERFDIYEILSTGTLFGSAKEGSHYGSLHIITRYGFIGFGLLIIFWSWIILRVIRLMSLNGVSITMLYLPISVLVTTFISFRIPQLNQLLSILLLVGTSHVYANYFACLKKSNI